MKKINLQDLFAKLTEKQLTIGSVESFTGGFFANVITNETGSSQFFKGGMIAYSDEVKINLLKIKKRIIKKYGAVSPETSEKMAINGKKILATDICVSFTGNADLDPSQNQRPYFGYMSIAFGNQSRTFEINVESVDKMNRELFKEVAVEYALKKIIEILN
jgi:PncC family amidohydrolase